MRPRIPIKPPQPLRLPLDLLPPPPGRLALLFRDDALQPAPLGLGGFLALGGAAGEGAGLGVGLGAQAGGFGVEGPLGAGVEGRGPRAGVGVGGSGLEAGEGGAFEVVGCWSGKRGLDGWGCGEGRGGGLAGREFAGLSAGGAGGGRDVEGVVQAVFAGEVEVFDDDCAEQEDDFEALGVFDVDAAEVGLVDCQLAQAAPEGDGDVGVLFGLLLLGVGGLARHVAGQVFAELALLAPGEDDLGGDGEAGRVVGALVEVGGGRGAEGGLGHAEFVAVARAPFAFLHGAFDLLVGIVELDEEFVGE